MSSYTDMYNDYHCISYPPLRSGLEDDMNSFLHDFKNDICNRSFDNEKDNKVVFCVKSPNEYCFVKVEQENIFNIPRNDDTVLSESIKQVYSSCDEDLKSIFKDLELIDKESQWFHKNGFATFCFKSMKLNFLENVPYDSKEDYENKSNTPISPLNEISEPKQPKKRKNLPQEATAILLDWLEKNIDHPYPSENEKEGLRIQSRLTIGQINNWFTNARSRKLKQLKAKRRKINKNNKKDQ